MENHFTVDCRQYYVFENSAYMLRPWKMRPFVSECATPGELTINTTMSSLSVNVEHSYKDLKQLWSSQDYAKALTIR